MNKYTSVTLPNEIMTIVDQRKKKGGYSSRAEYIKYLIRRDVEAALQ